LNRQDAKNAKERQEPLGSLSRAWAAVMLTKSTAFASPGHNRPLSPGLGVPEGDNSLTLSFAARISWKVSTLFASRG